MQPGLQPAPTPAPTPDPQGMQPAPTPTPGPQMMPPGPNPPVVNPPVVNPPPPAPAPAGPPRPKLALLVVGGNVNDIGRGDDRLLDILTALDFTVVLTDDNDDIEDAPDAGLVVISQSADAAAVAGTYRGFASPVLVMNSALFDDMRMTAGGQSLGTTNAREVEIKSPEHPLAAGLTGRVAIGAANSALSWGVPAQSAVVVATLTDQANRATVFGYEEAVTMAQNQKAPARRVGFFAGNGLTDRLSAEGTKLFQAAATWAWSR
jgi:hypothetical protein